MKIGFIGTLKGFNEKQSETYTGLLRKFRQKYDYIEYHSGDCKGGDELSFSMIIKYEIADKIEIHPPGADHIRINLLNNEKYKLPSDIKTKIRDTRPFSEIPIDITEQCDALIVLPNDTSERSESDLWRAVRYARKSKKNIFIIYPNGKATRWPAVKAGAGRR